MVVCTIETAVMPHPPPMSNLLKTGSVRSKKSTSSNGFRLQENQDDTCSVYSVYKQKIDSMFESDSSSRTHNSVQARIEKMFTDIAKDNGFPANDIGCHIFSVDYLGSVPLQEKVTSLDGLQNPLKELYFAYKKNSKHKKPLTGRLEISSIGLKVQYQGEKGDLEQLNSFPTIAVWSAVKFVLQDNPQSSYAFLPLITDPDNIDKQQLFRNLDATDKKYITAEAHSPLFAVVMRKIGVQKQLECHGFVCQTSEDAIVIAATLYKSLMGHMKAKEKEKRPKNKNGVTCMSITSSAYNDNSSSAVPVRPPRKKRSTTSSVKSDGDTLGVTDTQPLIRKKSAKSKKAPKAPADEGVDLDAILPYEEPTLVQEIVDEVQEIKPSSIMEKFNTYRSTHQKQITAEIKQVMTESTNMGLKRVKSVRKRNESGASKGNENSGDILTKVTIPRSGSFLNAGGLTRYKSKIQRTNGQASGGSPLGFSELFNEFRLQEGLHSIDEILGVIIDPEGMSFNDLKPIYKEFLLKLALTLTKDELYQRSKLIMRRHKKKLLRNASFHNKKRHVIVYNKFKRLKHIFQKIKMAKTAHRDAKVVASPDTLTETEGKLPESSISTSSYDTRQFRPKEPVQVARKQSYRKRAGDTKCSRRDRASTSEESDFFSLRRKSKVHGGSNQNRNSSSGYVSCSECSYDSDTCTCVSADKCYCSLGEKNFSKRGHCKSSPDACKLESKCYCSMEKQDLIWCGCDTDSCTDSNKCYCNAKKAEAGTIFEQLKQRGFIPTSDSVVTPPSHRKLCKKNSNTKSTKSLEYMPNPSEKYYEKLRPKSRANVSAKDRRRNTYSSDNLALDYELFSIANGSLCNIGHRSLYGRALSEMVSPNMKTQASVRSYSSAKYGQKGKTLQAAAIPVETCTEALSVKKSAEIAALFADVKLSQTTDIAHLIPRQIDAESFVACRNAFNRRAPAKHNPKLDRGGPLPYGNRMVINSLYSSKNVNKANLYSARNGLYTIQSQSDDSRSSLGKKSRRKEEYFKLQTDFQESEKPVSSGLENSLGYLP